MAFSEFRAIFEGKNRLKLDQFVTGELNFESDLQAGADCQLIWSRGMHNNLLGKILAGSNLILS